MPNRCVAAGCSSIPSDEVTLYKFSKDPVLRKKWVEQVKQTRHCWIGTSEIVVFVAITSQMTALNK